MHGYTKAKHLEDPKSFFCAGDMTECLRSCNYSAEDQSSIPTTHEEWLTYVK